MGRPTKLTDEVQAIICDALREGNSVEVASALAGIDPATFYRWQARGREEMARVAEDGRRSIRKSEKRYCDLCKAATRARAEAERQRVENIRNAGEEDWRASAWLLERTYPERYGRVTRQKLEHSGQLDVSDINITIISAGGDDLTDG